MTDSEELLDLAAMLEKKAKLADAKAALHRHEKRADDAKKESTNAAYCRSKAAVVAKAAKRMEKNERAPKVDPEADPAGFVTFWAAYPRHVGKDVARRAWLKWKCETFVPRILAALKQAMKSPDWTKDGGQFIPHPGTWLNREGWEDDFSVTAPAGKSGDPEGWAKWLEGQGREYSEHPFTPLWVREKFEKRNK